MAVEYAAGQAHSAFGAEARCTNEPLRNDGRAAVLQGVARCKTLLQNQINPQQVCAIRVSTKETRPKCASSRLNRPLLPKPQKRTLSQNHRTELSLKSINRRFVCQSAKNRLRRHDF